MSEQKEILTKWLFVILTPFQYRMMRRVFGEELHGKNSLIFVAPTVQHIVGPDNQRIQPLSFENFSFSDIKRKPFQKILEYRRRIGEIRDYLSDYLKEIKTGKELNVVIGSEKDNFTQVLLNLLYAQSGPRIYLHAIEEGLGYYVRDNRRDRLKASINN